MRERERREGGGGGGEEAAAEDDMGVGGLFEFGGKDGILARGGISGS